jgi:hypothetical protein
MEPPVIFSIYGSVREVLEPLATSLPHSTWAVVTGLDSGHESSFLRRVAAHNGLYELAGELPAARIGPLAKCSRIFYGWDEMWFFEERPGELRLTPKIIGTASYIHFDRCDPWPGMKDFHDSGAFMVIGDGDGPSISEPFRMTNIIIRHAFMHLLPDDILDEYHGS